MNLALLYLLYNFLLGLYFSFQYYTIEGRFNNNKEFWLLLFFPAMGLGKWKYIQLVRNNEPDLFPERWYMFKYMVKINWGYLILLVVGGFVVVFLSSLLVGSGLDWASHLNNSFSIGAGILFDIGALFLFFMVAFIAFLSLCVLYFILIHLPKSSMQKIEMEVYKQKYLDSEQSKRD
jgi:hypothetical protein